MHVAQGHLHHPVHVHDSECDGSSGITVVQRCEAGFEELARRFARLMRSLASACTTKHWYVSVSLVAHDLCSLSSSPLLFLLLVV